MFVGAPADFLALSRETMSSISENASFALQQQGDRSADCDTRTDTARVVVRDTARLFSAFFLTSARESYFHTPRIDVRMTPPLDATCRPV